jgi:hypothetical protein
LFGRAIATEGHNLDLIVGQYRWFRYRKNKYVLPGNGVVARHKKGGERKVGSREF